MGDILHALPAVTALRQAHPGWVIDWVVEPRWRALLRAESSEEKLASEARLCQGTTLVVPQTQQSEHRALAPEARSSSASPNSASRSAAIQVPASQPNPAQPVVDQLHLAPTKEWGKAPLSLKTLHEIRTLRKILRAGDYDAVLDLQGAIRSAVLGRLAGCQRLIGEAEPRERAARWLFTERVVTHGAHVVEQDIELASAVAGDELAPTKPWLPMDSAAEAWADEFQPPPLNRPAVLINPGAGWGAKRWPVERYAAVAQGLIDRSFRVLVNAGPGEEPLAAAIAHSTGGIATPLVCSLAQLIALTRRVALVIAGDTGPLHLACALIRPVVGIYGPTDPSRNGPFGTRYKVLRSPDSRRDHTRHVAPEAGLLTIQPEDVLRAADELLAEENAR
jgi:heptosyltransferase-1